MTKQQIGKCGELLVQFKLLMHGIESAPMTTDSGIDLVAFSNRNNKPVTIQVKTNLKPKPAGGRGKKVLDWWLPDDSPANAFAFVDLSSNSIWFFKTLEVAKHAQQHSSGRYHFGMYTESNVKIQKKRGVFLSEFTNFLIEKRINDFF